MHTRYRHYNRYAALFFVRLYLMVRTIWCSCSSALVFSPSALSPVHLTHVDASLRPSGVRLIHGVHAALLTRPECTLYPLDEGRTRTWRPRYLQMPGTQVDHLATGWLA